MLYIAPVPFRAQERRLSGFARRPVVRSRVYRPEWPDEVPAMLAEIPESLLPRGAGMAYGDAALNDGRGTLETRRLDRFLALDEAAATVTCEAGVPLRDLIRVGLRRGLFPAVVPGTWRSTVGGCLACDVHGKNHQVAGSFLDHVARFRLALADGRVVECSRQENPDLFFATAGGLGLTGVILDVTLRLRRVGSAWVRVRRLRNRDLDATFAALERPEPEQYSVAWLDVLARGGRLGRSVLLLGDHAAPEELPARRRPRALEWSPGGSLRLPFDAPGGAMSAGMVRLFNAAFWARALGDGAPRLWRLRRFFFPLEAVDDFARLYGRRGFVQYQFVAPPRAAPDILDGGPPDVSLFALGDTGAEGAFLDAAEVARVHAVNFGGVAALLSHLLPTLRHRRGAAIAFLASVAGDRGRRGNFVYGSAKAALDAYAQGLRALLHPEGISVTTVKLGWVDTRLAYGLAPPRLALGPERAARAVRRAVRRRRDVVYVPWPWRVAMLLLRAIPEPIFKRLPVP